MAMPQSEWDKKHHTAMMNRLYATTKVLLKKDGLFAESLAEATKKFGVSKSEYMKEALRRRLVEDGFILESDTED